MKTIEVLRSELLAEYEDDAAIIYGVDSGFRIRYCNRAWDRFAAANGGSPLLRDRQIGMSVMAVTPLILRPFYARFYESVLRTGERAEREYECSSDTIYRRFHMFIARRDVPGRDPLLVVVNSLVVEDEHPYESFPFDAPALRDENGLFTMCSHCRRTRLPGAHDCWVWVPELVRETAADVHHGMCSVCLELHYGR